MSEAYAQPGLRSLPHLPDLDRCSARDRIHITGKSKSSPRLIKHRRRRQPMRSARDTMIPSGPRT